MKRILISETKKFTGNEVIIKGWLHRIRSMGKIAFLLVRDRSGIIQCVVDTRDIEIKGLKLESVVEVRGTAIKNESVKDGVEIQVHALNVISPAEDLPIEINKESLELNLDVLLNNRVLSMRNPKINAIFRIQAALAQGFSQYLTQQGFTQIFTPKIVAEGTEGGTNLFTVDYFDKKAYLAQSPQFYKQMMVGAGYERVFETGHVYRAESHDTKRHLNEYVSLDLEMGFIEDEYEIMELETELLRFMITNLTQICRTELELLDAHIPVVPMEIPKLKLTEAIQILKTQYGKNNIDGDLDPEGEALISGYVKEKYNSDFVFLTHYSQSKRPMYTMPAGEYETHSFDLLFRGLEITTGGQRIHQCEKLKSNMLKHGLNPNNFEGYMSVFRHGMPPHGGLAIGLERITAMLLGLENVREASTFPRDRNRLAP
ncbi:aspartate--tRNA(Asn) ligase [Sedimentibacter hydroxybenzoicus DSM 7310]|uniref:Aspartate--tRNA ligase n=1 Tax=Sedimentibacter hydroxybenzoicus DSM 7310 TaxID=1123245 RepID=A0A974BKV0_SEDHY|nr:aspartate--tRNA(Asn) ligase [Sedimentibacter hydroxybenzoicus]NYB75018.1 aspartate--tRNA(Asn) ligase [Sedimentibacter hydroxybenzoicus DSM 7310]